MRHIKNLKIKCIDRRLLQWANIVGSSNRWDLRTNPSWDMELITECSGVQNRLNYSVSIHFKTGTNWSWNRKHVRHHKLRTNWNFPFCLSFLTFLLLRVDLEESSGPTLSRLCWWFWHLSSLSARLHTIPHWTVSISDLRGTLTCQSIYLSKWEIFFF